MSGLFRYTSTPTRPNSLSPFCVSGQDATMDSSSAFGYRSPTSAVNLHTANSGQGRSLREFDEKLHALQKENWNMKLRLYFLEEKAASAGNGGSSKAAEDEAFAKKYVDLQVKNEELRKELEEKYQLLSQAATAMELMQESQRKSNDKSSATIAELSQKIKQLEDELHSSPRSQQSRNASDTRLLCARSMVNVDVADTSNIFELEQTIRQGELKIRELSDQLLNAQKKLNERDAAIEEYEQRIEELESQLLQNEGENVRNASSDEIDIIPELKKQILELNQAMADQQCIALDLEEKLAAKTRAHDKGCQTIQLLLEKTSQLTTEVEQLKAKAIGSSTSSPSGTAAAEINSLRAKYMQAQADAEQADHWRKECVELCGVLSIRLYELAGFLDSLLNHKDVLSVLAQDRHRAMRKAVDRSLDLSRNLNNLSISAGIADRFSMNENSLLQLSSLTDVLSASCFDTSLKLPGGGASRSIIEALRAEIETRQAQLENEDPETMPSVAETDVRNERSCRNLSQQFDVNSESETWSEPDRKVSHERIGLDESVKMNTHVRSPPNKLKGRSSSGSDNNDSRSMRKNAMMRLQEKVLDLEIQLSAKSAQLAVLEAKTLSDSGAEHIDAELDEARDRNAVLQTELAEVKRLYVEMEKSLSTKLSECESERRENLEKLTKLEIELSAMKTDHARKIQAMTTEHERAIYELHDKHSKDVDDEIKRLKEATERDWVTRGAYQEKARKCHELGERVDEMEKLAQLMRDNETELRAQITEKEKSLRTIKRNADDVTMQMSKAVLERTKFMNERDQFELTCRELQEKCDRLALEKSELHSKLASLAHNNAQLHNKLVVNETQFQLTRSASQGNARYALTTSPKSTSCIAAFGGAGDQSGYTSDELKQRLENSSPDLGIESDGTGRSSGTDINTAKSPLSKLRSSKSDLNAALATMLLEGDEDEITESAQSPIKPIKATPISVLVQHDCELVERDNAELRRKLERTRRAFEKTWACLRISNQRKEKIEKDIRQEIYKTHSVLKNVRSNIESVNEVADKMQAHITQNGE